MIVQYVKNEYFCIRQQLIYPFDKCFCGLLDWFLV
nr:MAG TPA: hypothetical protein [Crassvirales sp.]